MIKNVIVENKPAKIAWIIKTEDWSILERVIKLNSWLAGGYHNIIIVMNDDNIILEEYQSFLESYDPDLIILPPEVKASSINRDNLNPFSIVEHEDLLHVVPDIDECLFSSCCLKTDELTIREMSVRAKNILVRSTDKINTDEERFELVLCGDAVERVHMDDNNLSYREMFLRETIKENLTETESCVINWEGLTEDYADTIVDKYKFNARDIKGSFRNAMYTQEKMPLVRTFINTTKSYVSSVHMAHEENKFITIFIGKELKIAEATMLWNLRANGHYIYWISMQNVKDQYKQLVDELYSLTMLLDFEEDRFEFYKKKIKIIVPNGTFDGLSEIEEYMLQKELNFSIETNTLYLGTFDYILPVFETNYSTVFENGTKYEVLLSNNIKTYGGRYISTIISDDFMLPYSDCINELLRLDYNTDYRISKDRYINVLRESNFGDRGSSRCTFSRVEVQKCFNHIFKKAGYGRFSQSSTGNFHNVYLKLCRNDDNAFKYLKTSPYKEIFELLRDNTDKNKPGWLEIDIDRRVLNILEIFELLGIPEPRSFKEVYKYIDYIPKEILELLDNSILERGFLLTCKDCSFKSWYSIEDIGQKFKCRRCNLEQIYNINPLWLCKLNEVVFAGLVADMHVPLLTVDYLKKKSKNSFQWVIDSDITFLQSNQINNLDIICLITRRLTRFNLIFIQKYVKRAI